MALQGKAGRGEAGHGLARQGDDSESLLIRAAGQGVARLGNAGRGWAMQGKDTTSKRRKNE